MSSIKIRKYTLPGIILKSCIYFRDYNNETPLMCAIKAGQEACVRVKDIPK